MDPAISTEGLTKSPGKSWGIRDVDLTANESEVLLVPTARARCQPFARARRTADRHRTRRESVPNLRLKGSKELGWRPGLLLHGLPVAFRQNGIGEAAGSDEYYRGIAAERAARGPGVLARLPA
jgi:hypothetical protein